ncbi:MAG: NUDIX domain-containing protein [Gammaproteobacteria bacterium]
MSEHQPRSALDLPLFRHCPRCADAAGARDDGRVFDCATCGFRYFHNVACAAAALITHAGTLLATRRAHAPAAGLLDVPGGFVDPGEDAASALRRELGEELGWTVESAALRYFDTIPNSYLYAGVCYATCDVFYRIELDGRPPITASEELAGHVWLPLDALDSGAFGFASVRRAVTLLRGTREELVEEGSVGDTVSPRSRQS